MSLTEAAQRTADMRFLLDAIRDYSDSGHQNYGDPLPVQELSRWLRTLDSLTLREYAKAVPTPLVATPMWSSSRGNCIDLIVQGQKSGLDDTEAALLLFVSNVVQLMGSGAAVTRLGNSTVRIFDESLEYMSGLFDTLRYHREVPLDSLVIPLMGMNIYRAPQESRDIAAALLKVTEAAVNSDVESVLRRAGQHDEEPPHYAYSGFQTDLSVWLSSSELVRYVSERPQDAALVAAVIAERKTGDLGTITAVIEHEVSALGSGSL